MAWMPAATASAWTAGQTVRAAAASSVRLEDIPARAARSTGTRRTTSTGGPTDVPHASQGPNTTQRRIKAHSIGRQADHPARDVQSAPVSVPAISPVSTGSPVTSTPAETTPATIPSVTTDPGGDGRRDVGFRAVRSRATTASSRPTLAAHAAVATAATVTSVVTSTPGTTASTQPRVCRIGIERVVRQVDGSMSDI